MHKLLDANFEFFISLFVTISNCTWILGLRIWPHTVKIWLYETSLSLQTIPSRVFVVGKCGELLATLLVIPSLMIYSCAQLAGSLSTLFAHCQSRSRPKSIKHVCQCTIKGIVWMVFHKLVCIFNEMRPAE